jgi:hypothetical protein
MRMLVSRMENLVPKVRISMATYCDDLETDQASDIEDVAPGHTEEEGDGVENVANNQFDCQIVISVEADVASPPGQQTRS